MKSRFGESSKLSPEYVDMVWRFGRYMRYGVVPSLTQSRGRGSNEVARPIGNRTTTTVLGSPIAGNRLDAVELTAAGI